MNSGESIKDAVERAVAKAPPLTPAQHGVISEAFAGAFPTEPATKGKKPNPRHELIERLAKEIEDV